MPNLNKTVSDNNLSQLNPFSSSKSNNELIRDDYFSPTLGSQTNMSPNRMDMSVSDESPACMTPIANKSFSGLPGLGAIAANDIVIQSSISNTRIGGSYNLQDKDVVKSDLVKKKTKIIFFYSDRFLRLYSNGDLAYFDTKTDELKTHIPFGFLK